MLELIRSETRGDTTTKHVAFSDDLGGAGELLELRCWWDNIVLWGPKLGYNPNPLKSWLVVKPTVEEKAREIFGGTNINITIDGRKYLGGYIGSESGRGKYAEDLVSSWCNQLKVLSKIAKTEPQAAYAAFVSGFKHKLTYYIRTMTNIKQHLTRLDAMVDNLFIPAITDGHICTVDERLLLSLPVKKGGLAIPIFSAVADFECANSRSATEQLVEYIINQDSTALLDSEQLMNSRRRIANTREELNNNILQQLREKLNPEQRRANDLTMMKGASSWLTILPLKSENFDLNKREFYDVLNLRYR